VSPWRVCLLKLCWIIRPALVLLQLPRQEPLSFFPCLLLSILPLRDPAPETRYFSLSYFFFSFFLGAVTPNASFSESSTLFVLGERQSMCERIVLEESLPICLLCRRKSFFFSPSPRNSDLRSLIIVTRGTRFPFSICFAIRQVTSLSFYRLS